MPHHAAIDSISSGPLFRTAFNSVPQANEGHLHQQIAQLRYSLDTLSSTFRNFMHRPVTSLPKDILAVTSARSWGLLRDRGDSILRVR